MQLIKTEQDYRQWMMNVYLYEDETAGESLLSEDEVETILFAHLPRSYPCLGVVQPKVRNPAESHVAYYYPDYIRFMAKEMGIMDL